MLLATFTFGDALLTTLEFAFLFLWIWIAVGVVIDSFRSHDLSNGSKALWMLFIIAIPYIGALGYLLVRGHKMHDTTNRIRQSTPHSASTRGALPRAVRRTTSASSPTCETAAC
jgi:Phospholipase_D-nuclease N-terminal